MVSRYKVVFWINSHKSEIIVPASSGFAARQMVEAQYAGTKVIITSVTKV